MNKEQFLKQYPEYLQSSVLDELRATDFSRLDEQGHTYLDYTGGNLYPLSLLSRHCEVLKNGVFGNPHSSNPSSSYATQLVEDARKKVLDYFQATDEYHCIFTQNASGALKIVGESYPFQEDGFFLLALDNHNSVNGIREFARAKGAEYAYTPLNSGDLRLNEQALEENLSLYHFKKNRLFAFPLQSNVSGVKHNPEWIARAKEKGWDVLADAAAFVPYNKLDLSRYEPDFVSVSFYKMFGYPTGIGCLLVHKNSFHKLRKPWFAGGTITAVSALGSGHIFDDSHARFEDGTLNYLDIPAVKYGLEFLESTGIEMIAHRIEILTRYLLTSLLEMKHENGQKLVQVYGPLTTEMRGGTLIFNVLDTDGRVLPYELIEQLANSEMISLRTGCFCNPGIDEANNALNSEELSGFFKMTDKGNYKDMIQFLGRLRGAIRISLGMVANVEDVEVFLNFIQQFRNMGYNEFLKKNAHLLSTH